MVVLESKRKKEKGENKKFLSYFDFSNFRSSKLISKFLGMTFNLKFLEITSNFKFLEITFNFKFLAIINLLIKSKNCKFLYLKKFKQFSLDLGISYKNTYSIYDI